jgi:hypothetical protein
VIEGLVDDGERLALSGFKRFTLRIRMFGVWGSKRPCREYAVLSPNGTELPIQDVRAIDAIGGKPDMPQGRRNRRV